MLLIDGVKYEEWTPTSEADFEKLVKDHTKEIFGEQSIYLDIKPYLKSVAGIGSVPDGLCIIYGQNPQWYIVEAELSNHSVYEHIVPQVARFTSGIKNPTTQKKVVDIIYNEILKDELLILKLRKAVAPIEIYKYLSDLISNQPILIIVIDKEVSELDDVKTALTHLQIKVLEFQTFTREGIGLSVHAHLFEPLCKSMHKLISLPPHAIQSDISESIVISLPQSSFRERHYIHLPEKARRNNMFPPIKTNILLETDIGNLETEQRISKPHDELKSTWLIGGQLDKWFKAHPELKVGDKVRITVIEPMNKYRLEIVK